MVAVLLLGLIVQRATAMIFKNKNNNVFYFSAILNLLLFYLIGVIDKY